jgi:hypothetical protein
MKTIATVLFFLLLGSFCAHGAIYNSDGSASDVQAKHKAASNGDTVMLPAGSFTWSTPVKISKAIKLQGAGSGRVSGWSRSTQTFGTGTKTFTVQNGFTVANGTTLRIWRTATDKETSYMLGIVTSVSGTTLTMNITSNTGSGTASLWLIATEFSTRVIHGAGTNVLLAIIENTGGSPEVSGIQFTTGSGTGKLITLAYTSGGRPILIHDCWFYQTKAEDIIRDESTNRGIIWNCSVNWSYFAQSNSQFLHLPINSRSEVWSSLSTIGMADTTGTSNIYVEDCDFHGGIGVADFDANSKVVWRHNIMDHAGLASHGYDTGPYGTRHWEIYDNQFLFANFGDSDGSKTLPMINHMLLRGGTGIITDNYMEDINSMAWGKKPEIQFGVWCLGRWIHAPGAYSADDGGRVEYPAPRQFGFGYVTGTGHDGQGKSTSQPSGYGSIYVGDSEPAYVWGNTGFTPVIAVTTDGAPGVVNQYGHIPDDPRSYIQAGRDYKLEAKPGYVKYTYPHPLRAPAPGATPTPTPTQSGQRQVQCRPRHQPLLKTCPWLTPSKRSGASVKRITSGFAARIMQRDRSRQGGLSRRTHRMICWMQAVPVNSVCLRTKRFSYVGKGRPVSWIFQSGVPFLSYSFGLPVIATDVRSLRNDIIEEDGISLPIKGSG